MTKYPKNGGVFKTRNRAQEIAEAMNRLPYGKHPIDTFLGTPISEKPEEKKKTP